MTETTKTRHETLNIHEGYTVTFTPRPKFDKGDIPCIRIRIGMEDAAGAVAVGYWYTDGTNNVMRGDEGTLLEAAQALIDFAMD